MDNGLILTSTSRKQIYRILTASIAVALLVTYIPIGFLARHQAGRRTTITTNPCLRFHHKEQLSLEEQEQAINYSISNANDTVRAVDDAVHSTTPTKIRKYRQRIIDDTVLMGQFNYASDVRDVLFWHQAWKTQFNRIVVRGPFSDDQIAEMRHHHGIDAHKGGDDAGFYSPMENLLRTLQQYKSVKGVKGVLYAHDDALINITNIAPLLGSETNIIVTDNDVENPRSGLDVWKRWDKVRKESFYIHPNGNSNNNKNNGTTTTTTTTTTVLFSKIDGFRSDSVWALKKSLRRWQRFAECIPAHKAASEDPRSKKYLEKDDGSYLSPNPIQADVMYVPTSLADEFAEAAQIMIDHKVFLECGFPKIVDMLRQTAANANIAANIANIANDNDNGNGNNSTTISAEITVSSANLCTYWDETRDSTHMLSRCGFPSTVVHPFKIRTHGYEEWSRGFQWATTSTDPFSKQQ